MTSAQNSHRVVVLGGGNAGMSVAGRIARAGVDDIVIVEPRTHHLYQPLFSHVAGGTAKASQARRPQQEVLPRGVDWIRDAATHVDPEARSVTLASGITIGYEHLIVCPGIRRNWGAVPGLEAAIRTPRVSSHYEFALARKTSRLLRDVRSGTVVFTQPPEPASCGGASQKPMYLACDYWRATGVLEDIRVILVVPGPTLAPVDPADGELERKVVEYGIEVRFSTELTAVDADAGTVTLRGASGEETLPYDVLNVVPPQVAPAWIAESGLADDSGFVDVGPELLRHRRFPEVWALGDAAATRNAKSGGALRKQTKALAENLVAVLQDRPPRSRYSGYTVIPFTVSRHTVVFAEFDDRDRPQPTIPGWTGLARERRLAWVFDRHLLPWVYWHLITKGRA